MGFPPRPRRFIPGVLSQGPLFPAIVARMLVIQTFLDNRLDTFEVSSLKRMNLDQRGLPQWGTIASGPPGAIS